MTEKQERDVEQACSTKEFVAELRRLIGALESKEPFTIQVAGERIHVPANAVISIEHERSEDGEELEFQLRWGLQTEEGEEEKEEEKEEEEEEAEKEEHTQE